MARPQFKIPLPNPSGGYYNMYTDTNPDHFSMFVDSLVDHVYIKEKERGEQTVNNNASAEVTHSLGYVPLVFAFLDNGDGSFTQLFGLDAASVVGEAGFRLNTTKLFLTNVSGSTKRMVYQMFYDNVDGDDSGLSVPYHNPVVVISKIGYNIFDLNPNHQLFRSDINGFKIVDEDTIDSVIPGNTVDHVVTQAHGLEFTPLTTAKVREEGYTQVFTVGGGNIYLYSTKLGMVYDIKLTKIVTDATSMKFYFTTLTAGDKTVHIRYKSLEKI